MDTQLCDDYHAIEMFGKARPHSLVGSVADLGTERRWFDPWLG